MNTLPCMAVKNTELPKRTHFILDRLERALSSKKRGRGSKIRSGIVDIDAKSETVNIRSEILFRLLVVTTNGKGALPELIKFTF